MAVSVSDPLAKKFRQQKTHPGWPEMGSGLMTLQLL
jgi:hypothetical protein